MTTDSSVSWADQLTAIGTLGAVALSLALAIYGIITASLDKRSRRAAEQRATERAHASSFHWWHELCVEHPMPYNLDLSTGEVYASLGLERCWGETLVLENTSDAPVHDVILHMPRYLLPGLTSFMPGEIGPHSRRVFHISGFGSSLIDPKFWGAGRVTFNDSQGLRWQREKSGELHRASLPLPEELESAEEVQLTLFRTINAIGAEYNWIDPARDQLRDVLRTMVTTPHRPVGYATRYQWQQLHHADSLAFRMLQDLPPRHYARRIATAWWRWRSGSLPLGDLISNSGLFFPHEASRLLASTQRVEPTDRRMTVSTPRQTGTTR